MTPVEEAPRASPVATPPASTATPLRCPFCREAVEPEDSEARECSLCETALHEACAQDHGRCTSLGCDGELGVRRFVARRAFRVEPPPPTERELWGRELARVPLGLWATLGLLATVAAAVLT